MDEVDRVLKSHRVRLNTLERDVDDLVKVDRKIIRLVAIVAVIAILRWAF